MPLLTYINCCNVFSEREVCSGILNGHLCVELLLPLKQLFPGLAMLRSANACTLSLAMRCPPFGLVLSCMVCGVQGGVSLEFHSLHSFNWQMLCSADSDCQTYVSFRHSGLSDCCALLLLTVRVILDCSVVQGMSSGNESFC